ncbi:MAG: alpha/beta fold hydrolase, partial [Acinetobacter sp.]|nr:alpha/beta fold hydrolase [Acinetobacter sp.]
MSLPLPEFRPLSWLRGGHLDTLYAKALQEPAPHYRRELLPDSLGKTLVAYDFVDAPQQDAPLVVLFHGLEGCSQSHYSIALMHAVQKLGWHGVVAHFRGCGGVMNTAGVAYHSGDSHELAYMLDTLKQRYTRIYAVGVSLGGNVLAKYLGEQGKQAVPVASAVVSAPLDLVDASETLSKGLNKRIYIPYFLRSLLPKIKNEADFHPPELIENILKVKTLRDFDHLYTAPLHGFSDPDDYYRRASAKPYLKHIQRPTLVINAKNDPFMSAKSLPQHHEVSASVQLLQPKRGGHIGFVAGKGKGHINWLPETLLNYFQQHEQMEQQ